MSVNRALSLYSDHKPVLCGDILHFREFSGVRVFRFTAFSYEPPPGRGLGLAAAANAFSRAWPRLTMLGPAEDRRGPGGHQAGQHDREFAPPTAKRAILGLRSMRSVVPEPISKCSLRNPATLHSFQCRSWLCADPDPKCCVFGGFKLNLEQVP
jgi:hypothetical protein